MADLDLSPPKPASASPGFFLRLRPVGFVLLTLGSVFLLYQLVAGGLTLLIVGMQVTEANATLMRVTTIVGQLVFILLPTLFLARARHGSIARVLRLNVPGLSDIVLAVVAMFALQQVLQGYMMLQDAIPLPTQIHEFVQLMRRMFDEAYRVLLTAHSSMEYVLVVMTVAVVPAISEELLFRGLVQRNIDGVTGGLRSAVVTGVVFGLYHLNPFSFVALSVLGVFLGYLVYRSQSTTLAIIAHFFNNFIATIAVYANLDEDFLVIAPSGGATPEFVAMNSAMFGVVFLAAMYYFTTSKRTQSTA
jgi:uncharacterized protein